MWLALRESIVLCYITVFLLRIFVSLTAGCPVALLQPSMFSACGNLTPLASQSIKHGLEEVPIGNHQYHIYIYTYYLQYIYIYIYTHNIIIVYYIIFEMLDPLKHVKFSWQDFHSFRLFHSSHSTNFQCYTLLHIPYAPCMEYLPPFTPYMAQI